MHTPQILQQNWHDCMVVDSCRSTQRTKEGEINRFAFRIYFTYCETKLERTAENMESKSERKRTRECERDKEREKNNMKCVA